MEKNTMINVVNRDNGAVFYEIPELNGLHRVFQAGERKEISFDELLKLSYLPGGMEMLSNNLIIENEEAVARIIGHVEPEYNYTAKDVRNLLENGSLDELLDCLDFAPEGVIDLVKTIAVDLPLNDVAKRDAILQKTNFNVTNAIAIKKEVEADLPKDAAVPSKRRVSKKTEVSPSEGTKTRRIVK